MNDQEPTPEVLGYNADEQVLYTSDGVLPVQNMAGGEQGECMHELCKRPAHEPTHFYMMSYVPMELHDHPDCRAEYEPLVHDDYECWCKASPNEGATSHE